MKFSILTLFPSMFEGPFSSSIIKRAVDKKAIQIQYINIRDFGIGKHQMVDDTIYGGGAGMLLRVDVVDQAIQAARCKTGCKEQVILLDAGGEKLTQLKVNTLASSFEHIILICAHYEGVDYRVRTLIDEEISIGDYVLTGGELPAMIITDAISRLIPGVLGKDASYQEESFQSSDKKIVGLLEHPQYTKPEVYKGMHVPQILLSGHHRNIALWRKEESKKRTTKVRPDLLIKRGS